MWTNNKLFIVILFLVFFPYSKVIANDIIISWKGYVDNTTEFKDNALPSGIAVGDEISGILRFDQTDYDKSSSILGNVSYGNIHYYYSGLNQSVIIGEWNWTLDSGEVTLYQYYNTNNAYFDVYTNSSSGIEFIEFPNYVGNFELGFALKDDQQPIDIFDSFSLDTATLDFNKVTGGEGHISSREWNENSDIIDGYYISFEILEASVSLAPVSENDIEYDYEAPTPENTDEDDNEVQTSENGIENHSNGGCFISSLQ